eukprot:scaffold3685_cov242-Pinguiococcus_pyrenoidosus.AAC.12
MACCACAWAWLRRSMSARAGACAPTASPKSRCCGMRKLSSGLSIPSGNVGGSTPSTEDALQVRHGAEGLRDAAHEAIRDRRRRRRVAEEVAGRDRHEEVPLPRDLLPEEPMGVGLNGKVALAERLAAGRALLDAGRVSVVLDDVDPLAVVALPCAEQLGDELWLITSEGGVPISMLVGGHRLSGGLARVLGGADDHASLGSQQGLPRVAWFGRRQHREKRSPPHEFAKAVEVELPLEAREVPVPEEVREDLVLEGLLVHDDKAAAVGRPPDGVAVRPAQDLVQLVREGLRRSAPPRAWGRKIQDLLLELAGDVPVGRTLGSKARA